MNSARRRRQLGMAMIVVLAAVGGYFSTCVLYPARLVPKRVEVPALRGLAGTEAIARIAEIGLRGRIVDSVPDAEVPAGTVAWQSPAPGTSLPEAAVVRIALSRGAPPIVVPDLEGMTLPLAEAVLRAAGVTLGVVDTVRSRADAGSVVRTRPAAGSPIRLGQRVDISISGVEK